MRTKKTLIYALAVIALFFVGRFIYYDCIRFEIKRELIYQCHDVQYRDSEFIYFANLYDLCNEYPEFKNVVETKFKCSIDEIDTNKYFFLTICGGDIQSFKMVKNTHAYDPFIKYKKGVSKDTISIYLMTDNRYIEFSDI